MQFKSVYSMRFYELLSGQTNPLKYSIEEFRKMFSLEKKFKAVADIERYVLEVAQKELDEKQPLFVLLGKAGSFIEGAQWKESCRLHVLSKVYSEEQRPTA